MNRFSTTTVRALAVLCALCSSAVFAATETTGRVEGYVYDPTGAALSEVPLTISGSAMQGQKTTTTGDDGRYGFTGLEPAEDYVVEVNVPGFTPIQLKGIKVRLGQATINDINLTVLTEQAAAQTFQIIEKVNPVLNPDTATAVAVIDAEKAAMTPIFQQVEGMAQQVAGVGPGNRPSTRGGFARYGKFYVDGMDTTDVTDGSITAPMNFNAVQNFEIMTGAMDAQYNSMGMITNAVTKSGGNRFTYDVAFTFQPTPMAAKPNYPAQQFGFLGQYTNNDFVGPNTSFYAPVVNIGGPLIKDKLWFFFSSQANFSLRENPITIANIRENRPTNTLTELARLKLTWAATTADKVSFAVNFDHNSITNNVGTASVTDNGENQINRGGFFVILNYDHSFTDSVLFQLETGVTKKRSDQDPMRTTADGSIDYQTISHRDTTAGITDFNSGSISSAIQGAYLHETKWRIQFDPTISWKLRGMGTHQMKAGVQTSFMIDEQATGVPGNRRYVDRGGVCNEADPATYSYCFQRIDYTGNQGGSLDTKARAFNIGLFLQDRWTVNRRLTIIPGMRFDIGRLYGDQSALGDDTLVATLVGLGPRLSATFDLFGDRRTLLVAHAGRSNDIGNIFVAQHANPQLTAYQSTFNTTTNSFPDCAADNTQSGCSTSGGPAGRQFVTHKTALFDKVSDSPHVDEFSAGVHSEVSEETVIGIDYTYRYYGSLWADEEVNRIWDASGTRILGYQNGINQQIYMTEAPGSAYRVYHGTDLWVQGTPGRWDLLASYTLAFNKGTVDDYFDGYLQNPRMAQYYYGFVSDDRRHTLKGSIAYRLPFGLDLGFRVQYRTGSPNWENYTNPADGTQRYYRSPRGTGFPNNTTLGKPDFNDPNSWTDLRNPDQFTLDLQARYNLGQALKTKEKFEIVLLVVNSLNNTGPQFLYDSYTTSATNRFGQASSHFSPLQAEFMFRVRN
ncbi:MAG: TonB-dependent receptor [Deltaproteobacteria bacterium]|nr:TonB-dependent receptor [Deltaproteobacteria bacterium]